MNHVLIMNHESNQHVSCAEDQSQPPSHTSGVTAISALLAVRKPLKTPPIQPSLLSVNTTASCDDSIPLKENRGPRHQRQDLAERMCRLFQETEDSKHIRKWLGFTRLVPVNELEYMIFKAQKQTRIHPKPAFVGMVRKYLLESGKISQAVYDKRRGTKRRADEAREG